MEIVDIRKEMVLIKPRKKVFSILEVRKEEETGYENVGIVVKVGEGKRTFEVGDEVIFPVYAGRELEVEGEKYLLMSFDCILATVEKV